MALAQQSWSETDWLHIGRQSDKLRNRVGTALAKGDTNKALELASKMSRSYYEILRAVRKVTEEARGRCTPGIDNRLYSTDAEKMELVWQLKLDWNTKPSPLKPVSIPKANGGERELAIPTVFDRARQTLLVAVFQVLNEHRFGPGSFGVGGKKRGIHGAYRAICDYLDRRPAFTIRTDIRDCFAEVYRASLLDTLLGPNKLKAQAAEFLDSGTLVGGEVVHTDRGAPQGLCLSPLLINLALNALEEQVISGVPDGQIKPFFARYVDDIMIIHPDPGVVCECYSKLGDCLEPHGLQLNGAKTHIGLTEVGVGRRDIKELEEGFDFLGYSLLQYPNHEDFNRLDAFIAPRPAKTPKKSWVIADAGRMIKAVKGKAVVVESESYRGWDTYALTPKRD